MDFISDFLALIYPRTCAACGNSLWKNEKVICTFCDYHLPKTRFHLEQDNDLLRIFRGRVPVESAAAFYYFNKGNKVQHLVHQLKYKGRKDIGIFLGERFGQLLLHSPFFSRPECIIPVPLHLKKQAKRGFNQSEQFARGLARSMALEMNTSSLVRLHQSETQTRKSRYRRWENVSGTFHVMNGESLAGKHLLLADDVVTTGATLEACIQALGSVPGIKVSIAAIAFTMI